MKNIVYRAIDKDGYYYLACVSNTLAGICRDIDHANAKAEKAGYEPSQYIVVCEETTTEYDDDGLFMKSTTTCTRVGIFPDFESKRDLTELNKLENYLINNNISYERTDIDSCGVREVHQVRTKDWDAICHYGSYGNKDGLLEIGGSLVTEKERKTNGVAGWLTADNVIERIEKKGGINA